MNKISISLTNAKLGSKIPSINLPAGKTCRGDAPCQKGCYAKKGNWLFPNVVKSLENNLNIFVEDKEEYFNQIVKWVNNDDVIYKFFRWHSSGDIVNYDYLLGMVKVAKKCKNTKFLCFTKKFWLVNHYLKSNKLPKNLRIVFSAWDKTFDVLNPYNLPVTYVNFKNKAKNTNIPEFAIPCIGECSACKSCWSLKEGQSVVFNEH